MITIIRPILNKKKNIFCRVTFFKIDYYDLNYEFMSKNPANPDITNRVLSIMLAEEY